jgi:YD repeat-containing protein
VAAADGEVAADGALIHPGGLGGSGDGSAEVYGYDALSRLTSVTYPSGRRVRYDYDPVGNRLAMHEGTSGSGPAPCSRSFAEDATEDATMSPRSQPPTPPLWLLSPERTESVVPRRRYRQIPSKFTIPQRVPQQT